MKIIIMIPESPKLNDPPKDKRSLKELIRKTLIEISKGVYNF